MAWLTAALVCVGAAACNGQTKPDAPAVVDERELPCAVTDVLDRKCRTCHERKPAFGAPMALVTRADLLAPLASDPSKRAIDSVIARVNDASRPMPPAPLPALTAAERQALADWSASPTPGACDKQIIDDKTPVSGTLDCTPDLTLAPPTKYEMPATSRNEYICYRVDVDTPEDRQVIGLTPRPDNATILHHVLLFRIDDEAEAQRVPKTPTRCDAMRSTGWTFLYGWAPGTGAMKLPPNVGLNQPKRSHYVVQLHYNNANRLAGERDGTGFGFCTTTQLRPFEADVVAFGTGMIRIPAKSTASYTCDFTIPAIASEGMHVLAMNPHMHGAGTSISTEHIAKTGETAAGETTFAPPVTLAAIDPWNYQDQQWSPVSAVLKPGDVVRHRCAYRNETTRTITFGENTEDEMCFGFTLYYPRIRASFWSWGYPSATSECTSGP
jgi:hypothetical protein